MSKSIKSDFNDFLSEQSPASDPALAAPSASVADPSLARSINNYVITDSTVSRNLLYQKLNKTSQIHCEYSYYGNEINEYTLATAVRNAVGDDNLYYSEFGFPGSKTVVKEEDWDEGNYIFVIENEDSGRYDLIHKKSNSVFFLSSSVDKARSLREFFTKKINREFSKLIKKTVLNDKINLLMKSDSYYFSSVSIDIEDVAELDLEMNYGAGFAEKSKAILLSLQTGKKGLFLIHGKMGSGKTSFIRYLISRISNKRVIFIPPYFTDFLSSPEFLPTLVSDSGAKNSILIIEDAEKVVISREDDSSASNSISSLLNLSDGILGNIANCQIICTFNTRVENIDSALLRKGRLIAEVNINALSALDSQRLVDKLAAEGKIKPFVVKKEMTLAEIYGADSDNFHKEKEDRKIGFGFK